MQPQGASLSLVAASAKFAFMRSKFKKKCIHKGVSTPWCPLTHHAIHCSATFSSPSNPSTLASCCNPFVNSLVSPNIWAIVNTWSAKAKISRYWLNDTFVDLSIAFTAPQPPIPKSLFQDEEDNDAQRDMGGAVQWQNRNVRRKNEHALAAEQPQSVMVIWEAEKDPR